MNGVDKLVCLVLHMKSKLDKWHIEGMMAPANCDTKTHTKLKFFLDYAGSVKTTIMQETATRNSKCIDKMEQIEIDLNLTNWPLSTNGFHISE